MSSSKRPIRSTKPPLRVCKDNVEKKPCPPLEPHNEQDSFSDDSADHDEEIVPRPSSGTHQGSTTVKKAAKAEILPRKARILTKKARILTKKARILTKKARILTRKARILTKKARILPKNKNLAAIILDLGQDLGQDTQESGQDLRKDTHEFRQDLGKMKFKILSCHKILPKNLAQEFFAG
ncbi:hypothetical protein EMCRGX_G017149 [Ephydatia muelleri]